MRRNNSAVQFVDGHSSPSQPTLREPFSNSMRRATSYTTLSDLAQPPKDEQHLVIKLSRSRLHTPTPRAPRLQPVASDVAGMEPLVLEAMFLQSSYPPAAPKLSPFLEIELPSLLTLPAALWCTKASAQAAGASPSRSAGALRTRARLARGSPLASFDGGPSKADGPILESAFHAVSTAAIHEARSELLEFVL